MSEHDPAYDIAKALTDQPRTFRAIAAAFEQAAGEHKRVCENCSGQLATQPPGLAACPQCGADATLTPIERGGVVVRCLVDRYMLIDQIAFVHAMMAMTGYLAERTGKTPRQVHEEMFAAAPDDAWWRGKHEQAAG